HTSLHWFPDTALRGSLCRRRSRALQRHMDGCLRYRGQCFSHISGSSHIGSFRKDPEQCSLCKDRPPSHTSSCSLRSHARWHLLLDLSSRLRGGSTYTALFHRHILRLDTVSGLLHRESNHTCHGEVRESAELHHGMRSEEHTSEL